jgi:hypothetical protein
MGSLLQRGLCEDRVFQIFREVATLSCPCDELRWMCHDVLENDCTSYCKIIYPADNCSKREISGFHNQFAYGIYFIWVNISYVYSGHDRFIYPSKDDKVKESDISGDMLWVSFINKYVGVNS